MNLMEMSNEEIVLYLQENFEDDDVKNFFFERNSKLIHNVCYRIKHHKMSHDDKYSMCVEGMLKAIKNYNPDFGTKFTTYVVPMMIGEMQKHYRDRLDDIKFSRSVKDIGYKIIKFDLMEKEIPEIIKILKDNGTETEEKYIRQAFDFIRFRNAYSMDEVSYNSNDGDDITLKDTFPVFDDFTEVEVQSLFDTLLTEKERKALFLYLYKEKSQQEIGDGMGLSQVQISRLIKSALNKLKKFYTGKEEIEMGKPGTINKGYVKFIVENYPSLKASSIARILGVTTSGIDYYLKGKRLEKVKIEKPNADMMSRIRKEYLKATQERLNKIELETSNVGVENKNEVKEEEEMFKKENHNNIEGTVKGKLVENEPIQNTFTAAPLLYIPNQNIILENRISYMSNQDDIISLLNGIINMIETTPEYADVKLELKLSVLKKDDNNEN